MKTFNVAQHSMTLFAAAVAVLAAGSVLSGCSFSAAEKRVMRIELPEVASGPTRILSSHDPMSALFRGSNPFAYAYTGTGPGFTTEIPKPTSFDQLTCFGVNITGPGIAPDPRLRCTDPKDLMGITAGFVSVQNGYLEVSVPTGPARMVQLFGVPSVIGCPSLSEFLDRQAQGERDVFKPIGDAMLIGQTGTDVYEDTSVTIYAGLDASTPEMFTSCGDGHSSGAGVVVPLAKAYKGETSMTSSPFPAPLPGPQLGAPEISGIDTTATLVALNGFEQLPGPGPTPTAFYSGTPVTDANSLVHFASSGKRAVVQLQFDVGDLADTKPYMDLRIQWAAGAAPSASPLGAACSTANGYVSVFNGHTNSWIRMRTIGRQAGSTFMIEGSESYYLASDLAVTMADGSRVILVQVESSQFGSACASMVSVDGASLRLMDQPYPLRMEQDHFQVPIGGSTTLKAVGGVMPYTFQVSSGNLQGTSATGSQVGPAASVMIGGRGLSYLPPVGAVQGDTATVKVIDSKGAISSLATIHFGGSPVQVDGWTHLSLASCIPYTAKVYDQAGTVNSMLDILPPSLGTAEFYLSDPATCEPAGDCCTGTAYSSLTSLAVPPAGKKFYAKLLTLSDYAAFPAFQFTARDSSVGNPWSGAVATVRGGFSGTYIGSDMLDSALASAPTSCSSYRKAQAFSLAAGQPIAGVAFYLQPGAAGTSYTVSIFSNDAGSGNIPGSMQAGFTASATSIGTGWQWMKFEFAQSTLPAGSYWAVVENSVSENFCVKNTTMPTHPQPGDPTPGPAFNWDSGWLAKDWSGAAWSATVQHPMRLFSHIPGGGNPVTKLWISGPSQISDCSSFVVHSQDSNNVDTNVSVATSVALQTVPGVNGGSFYSDGGCTSPRTSVAIPVGTSVASFYFKPNWGNTEESVQFRVTATGLTPHDFTATWGATVHASRDSGGSFDVCNSLDKAQALSFASVPPQMSGVSVYLAPWNDASPTSDTQITIGIYGDTGGSGPDLVAPQTSLKTVNLPAGAGGSPTWGWYGVDLGYWSPSSGVNYWITIKSDGVQKFCIQRTSTWISSAGIASLGTAHESVSGVWSDLGSELLFKLRGW